MNKWFDRYLAVVNLVLVSFCIISYAATIHSLVFWTDARWSEGELGGVLDYRWLGSSVVYHVVQENLEEVFSFPDFTSYFLIAFIIFNLVALFLSRGSEITRPHWICIRYLTAKNIIITVVCMWAYVGTMMFIDSKLRVEPHIGGVVYYQFPVYIWVTHVYKGHIESSLNWHTLDLTLWLLLVSLISTVIIFLLSLASKDDAMQ